MNTNTNQTVALTNTTNQVQHVVQNSHGSTLAVPQSTTTSTTTSNTNTTTNTNNLVHNFPLRELEMPPWLAEILAWMPKRLLNGFNFDDWQWLSTCTPATLLQRFNESEEEFRRLVPTRVMEKLYSLVPIQPPLPRQPVPQPSFLPGVSAPPTPHSPMQMSSMVQSQWPAYVPRRHVERRLMRPTTDPCRAPHCTASNHGRPSGYCRTHENAIIRQQLAVDTRALAAAQRRVKFIGDVLDRSAQALAGLPANINNIRAQTASVRSRGAEILPQVRAANEAIDDVVDECDVFAFGGANSRSGN